MNKSAIAAPAEEPKTKYFCLIYDMAGVESIAFWKALTEAEVEQLTGEYGSLTNAFCSEVSDSMAWVLSESEVKHLARLATTALGWKAIEAP